MVSFVGPPDQPTEDKALKTPLMDGQKPLNIVIIGGSSSGLFAGILLKRQGHNIRILESASSSAREGLAAGVGLAAHVKQFFDEYDRLKDVPFGTPNDFLEILDWNMNVTTKMPMNLRMTTWDSTYYRLRANYDSFQSPYCQEPPPPDPSEGNGTFESGKLVIRVEDIAGDLTLLVEDVTTQKQERIKADIAIAADGANSTIRRQLHPDSRREEPGYVLWRGTIPTKDVSKNLLDKIENRTILYPMRHSYCIIYTVPGFNGSLKDGEREINWAQYTWPARSLIQDILTDTDGHQHRTTLPKGKMRPEIWQKQMEHARRMFHPELVELAEKIKEPFVSVISSTSYPRAAYFNNRLFFIGDALAQKQPNTAQGTNLAAMDAMSLANMVAAKMSPQEWEERVLETAERERLGSIAFASQRLCTWWGMALNEVRYRWLIQRQSWMKWWYGGATSRGKAKV